jgi:RNA polymerase sigma-70 factor (ECF subfamily)
MQEAIPIPPAIAPFEDADLVRAIAQSSDSAEAAPSAETRHSAEAELCRRFAPRIRLYGLRHLRDAGSADDLVQHVLSIVLQHLRAARLKDADKLSSYILGTCRMTMLDWRRTNSRRDVLKLQFAAEQPSFLNPVSTEALDRRALAGCLQSLKDRERTAIIMTFYDEHTSAQVARALNTTENNVRVIRHRALAQLRSCLGVAA